MCLYLSLISMPYTAPAKIKNLRQYLREQITCEIDALAKQQKKMLQIPVLELTKAQEEFVKNKAAKEIQRFWRTHKIKEKLQNDPYNSYLSLMSQDDEQYLLATLMFGRHQAEVHQDCEGHINNPFIYQQSNYHRGDILRNKLLVDRLLDALLDAFNVPKENKDKYTYLPITLLKGTPIDEAYAQYQKRTQRLADKLIISENQSMMALIETQKNATLYFGWYLINLGLTASPWELSSHIKTIVPFIPNPENIKLDSLLPATQDTLLASKMVRKLFKIGSNDRYPTQKLAICLQQLLQPAGLNLKAQAIQRMALIIDIATTFYANNYPRFSFCVYAIIHEISLALAAIDNHEYFDELFCQFWDESKYTLFKSLGLNEQEQQQIFFIATPAMAGTNAHAIALRLAQKMKTNSGETLAIKVFEPSYFEFQNMRISTNNVDADIFAITTGAVVNEQGITPGIDINLFVRRHIINANRTRPATLLIDASTTLYKNLYLNDETKALVAAGQLSIIVYESHQKFGLIHTDQAQYGRMFAICSNQSFEYSMLEEIKTNAQYDFNSHLDLRIGAFINIHCSEVLEEIKQQHFSNGALMRNLLSALFRNKIIVHEDMLTNLDELYFFSSASYGFLNALQGIINTRGSFGHFSSTLADIPSSTRLIVEQRVSSNASDSIDSLIENFQIYLQHYYKPEDLLQEFLKIMDIETPVSKEDQIIALAMVNNLISYYESSILNSRDLYKIYPALGHLLSYPELSGRFKFIKAQRYYFKLHFQIVSFIKDVNQLCENAEFSQEIFFNILREYKQLSVYRNSLTPNIQRILEQFERYVCDNILKLNTTNILQQHELYVFFIYLEASAVFSKNPHYSQLAVNILSNAIKSSYHQARFFIAHHILKGNITGQIQWATQVLEDSNTQIIRNRYEHKFLLTDWEHKVSVPSDFYDPIFFSALLKQNSTLHDSIIIALNDIFQTRALLHKIKKFDLEQNLNNMIDQFNTRFQAFCEYASFDNLQQLEQCDIFNEEKLNQFNEHRGFGEIRLFFRSIWGVIIIPLLVVACVKIWQEGFTDGAIAAFDVFFGNPKTRSYRACQQFKLTFYKNNNDNNEELGLLEEINRQMHSC